LAVRRLLGDLRDLHGDHIDALLAGLARGVGYHLDLPRGLRFDVGYEEAVFTLEQGEAAALPPAPSSVSQTAPPEALLTVPGVTSWGPWLVEAELAAVGLSACLPDRPAEEAGVETPSADPWQAWLDADVTGEGLRVRSRRPGDRFRPLGLGGEKKLQDFFVDARIPRAERDAVPLVCGKPGIVWVVGHRIDERARVTEATHRLLRLRFRRVQPLDRPGYRC
jgi:tRNA(Ile)-lysidine synthase